MSKRRSPLKSSLSGQSPVTATPAQQTEPTQVTNEASQPVTTSTNQSAAGPAPKKRPAKTKVAYYQEVEEAARVRGGFHQVGHLEGYRTFSDFHAAVVLAEIQRLEAKYNEGEPFIGAAPGTGRLGRPLE